MKKRERCDRYDREGALFDAPDPIEEHISTCPDCAEARRGNEWIRSIAARMTRADFEPPPAPMPGWEARLDARLDARLPPRKSARGMGMSPTEWQGPGPGDAIDPSKYIAPLGPTIAKGMLAAAAAVAVLGFLFRLEVREDEPRRNVGNPPAPPTSVTQPIAPAPYASVSVTAPPLPVSQIVPTPRPPRSPAPACTEPSAGELNNFVSSHSALIRSRCWQRAVNSGAATEARALIYLKVAPNGHVVASHVVNGGPPEVAACIENSARAWRFPPLCQTKEFRVPFRLDVQTPAPK